MANTQAQTQGANAYQLVSNSSNVESASPHRLIQLLLDGALQRIATAKGHVLRNESALKGEQIGKAISIVAGLRASLDTQAGEVSQNLDDLYDYIGRRLLAANINDDIAILDEVADLLHEIKSAWDVVGEADSPAGDVGAPPAP